MGSDIFAALFKSHFLPFIGFFEKILLGIYFFSLVLFLQNMLVGTWAGVAETVFHQLIQNNLRARTTFHQFSFSWCLFFFQAPNPNNLAPVSFFLVPFFAPKIDPFHFTFRDRDLNGVKMRLKITSKKLLIWSTSGLSPKSLGYNGSNELLKRSVASKLSLQQADDFFYQSEMEVREKQ